MIRRMLRRARHLLFGARSRRELDEEMLFHMDALASDLQRQGMSAVDARREAQRRFGNPERVHERARQERGLALIDETGRNLRLAARSLSRTPMFTSTFVATLALCIGLATAVFAIVDAVLWQPLPYPAPAQLAHAVLFDPTVGKTPGNSAVDGRTWERIRDGAAPLKRAVYSGWARGVNLTANDRAAFVQQQRVGTGYFNTLGVTPALGREFSEAEDVPGGPPVAILSHELWSRTFNRDADMLGGTIRLKGETHTVVGIMPDGFQSQAEADVWTPLRPSVSGEGGGTNYGVLVRVPEGMSLAEADARLASIAPPPQGDGAPDRRFGLVGLDDSLTAGLRTPMAILMGGVALMLIVGCANLAGLQIARTLSRRTEMATRQALGSGTGALVRQVVAENAMLGALGGGLGVGAAFLGFSALEGLMQSHFGIWQTLALDERAIGVGVMTTVLSTLFFGLAPVLHATASGGFRTMRPGARVMGGGHRLRKALLVGQVAMVTTLLFGAGLLVRSYGYLEGLDPGFDPEGVLAVQYSLDDARYAQGDQVHRLFTESLEGIRDVPGVTSAAVSLTLPYERPLNLPFRVAESTDNRVANAVYVTPGFFQTLGVPVLRGRVFDDRDRTGEPMAIVVNQAFVDAYLDEGQAIETSLSAGFVGDNGARIVGVVGNVQQSAGWGDTNQPVWETPTMYMSADQMGGDFFSGIHIWFSPSWVIRTERAMPDLSSRVTEVFRSVDGELPVARTATLNEVMSSAFARQRFEAAFLVTVAFFALLLAGIGLYGIVAHEVLERRREMGLRMALGATPGGATWTTGAAGLRLALAGLVLGCGAAFAVSRVLERLIWGVAPYDPATLAALVAVIGTLASVASFVPAARVGRLDPANILRDG